jgi:hypothetical protein
MRFVDNFKDKHNSFNPFLISITDADEWLALGRCRFIKRSSVLDKHWTGGQEGVSCSGRFGEEKASGCLLGFEYWWPSVNVVTVCTELYRCRSEQNHCYNILVTPGGTKSFTLDISASWLNARIQTSDAVQMKSCLFRDVTQRMLVVTDVLRQTIWRRVR